AWLVVADEADSIVEAVRAAAACLRERGRRDMHFLLASRDTDWDWASARARAPSWPENQPIKRELRGVGLADARIVVAAWARYGAQGLKGFVSLGEDERADRLATEAHSQAKENPQEGAFLGAMLRLRQGDDLKDRV